VIKIGRANECEITIEDNMLSRVHCTIEYQENVGWIIRDGYNIKTMTGSYEVKQSTNGTWYLFFSYDDLGFMRWMIL
jgi:pSer/pThr/pTyr-binding forkhead associated (FHA) protein